MQEQAIQMQGTQGQAPAQAHGQSTTRVSVIAIVAALALGVIGDVLLREGPWGINLALVVLAIAGAVFVTARWGRQALGGGGRWLAIPAVLLAAAFAWHDSGSLLAGDFLVLLIVLALFAARAHAGQLRTAGLIEYAIDLFMTGLFALFGAFVLVFQDIRWRELRLAPGAQPRRWASGAARVVFGALLALPLLLIFGGLFSAADASFAQLVRDLFRVNLSEFITHSFVIAVLAWLAAGFLRVALLSTPVRVSSFDTTASTASTASRLGIVETATALGLLNLLFLAFVILQFRYLFGLGGMTALGYAEYARRGFFELVAVAALVLPVLLVAHWLLRKDNPAHVRVFNTLAGALIALLVVIMASALQRMALYVGEFGLTGLRLYTTAFMGWLALVFAWFVFTVLRGQRSPFAFGALVAGIFVTLALNVLNPDYFIARVNADRAIATGTLTAPANEPGQNRRALDAGYLVSLSGDALPVVLEVLPQLPDPLRCQTATRILQRWSPPESVDWRTWNWSRAQAWGLVSAQESALKEMACPLPTRD
jgi:hypothetical protein